MIIEVRDIIDNKQAVAHANPAPGTTLGAIFKQHDALVKVAPYVHQVTINGLPVDNWREAPLATSDHVVIDLMPGGPFLAIIQIVIMIVSLIVNIVMMFMKPKPVKLNTPKDSQTYSFDGIKTSYTPNGPVPVIYGEHLTGGQLLGLAIDVDPTRNDKQRLNMLIGLGVGPVTDVSCVKLNGVQFANFADTASWDFRLGYSSQSVIDGFAQVRNTFADGRQIASGTAVVYATQGTNIERVQLQVAALQGLGIFLGGTNPQLATQTVEYSIEYKLSTASSWTIVESPHLFRGKSRSAVWDAPMVEFGSRAAWDVRLLWLRKQRPERADKGDQSTHDIWLRNVTEISDERSETYSGNALLAVKAVATNQLQGGAPTVTAMVRGRDVRCYLDENTYVTTWSRNPAWCILDYMTNSRYGMGAYIPTSSINLRSFIDFASLCNSQVSDGLGGLEAQHYLDLSMDKKKPHWSWINEMLGLYRSAMLYSQGKYKIISDRGDLPVRQIFHAGNIIPSTFQLTMGTADPIKPNQAVATFPNQATEYNLDTIYVQDSASVYGANDPIKDFDMSLIGITRESEAFRETAWQLARHRQTAREVKFSTGLEALAVEPGDLCKVGIVTTNYELGYGGRILDGSIGHLTLDREVQVNSGRTYELMLWHIGADSMEIRTVATTPGSGYSQLTTIVVSPTNGFNITPNMGDRWAIGVASEDLMTCWVTKTSRDTQGRHEITAQQFNPINPLTPVLVPTNIFARNINDPPPQPISVVGTAMSQAVQDGTVVSMLMIDVTPAPLEEGGMVTGVGCTTNLSYQIVGSHAPIDDALCQDVFATITGPSSYVSHIQSYSLLIGGGKQVSFNSADNFALISSGDAYTIHHRGGEWSGFDLWSLPFSIGTGKVMASSHIVWNRDATVLGMQYEIPIDPSSFNHTYKVVPFSTLGVRNELGVWVFHVAEPAPLTPSAPTSLTVFGNIKRGVNQLAWVNPDEPNISNISVYRNTTNAFGSSTPIANAGRVTQFDDIGATVETSYWYWIRAWNTSSAISAVHPSSTAGVYGYVSANKYWALSPNSARVPEIISTNPACLLGVTFTASGQTMVFHGGAVFVVAPGTPGLGAMSVYLQTRVGSNGGVNISPKYIPSVDITQNNSLVVSYPLEYDFVASLWAEPMNVYLCAGNTQVLSLVSIDRSFTYEMYTPKAILQTGSMDVLIK